MATLRNPVSSWSRHHAQICKSAGRLLSWRNPPCFQKYMKEEDRKAHSSPSPHSAHCRLIGREHGFHQISGCWSTAAATISVKILRCPSTAQAWHSKSVTWSAQKYTPSLSPHSSPGMAEPAAFANLNHILKQSCQPTQGLKGCTLGRSPDSAMDSSCSVGSSVSFSTPGPHVCRVEGLQEFSYHQISLCKSLPVFPWAQHLLSYRRRKNTLLNLVPRQSGPTGHAFK